MHQRLPREHRLGASQLGQRPKVGVYGLIAGQRDWLMSQYGSKLNLVLMSPDDGNTRVRDVARSTSAVVCATGLVNGAHLKMMRKTCKRYFECPPTASSLHSTMDRVVAELAH